MTQNKYLSVISGSAGDLANALEEADFLSYLPEDICAKVDRMSMKVSLETRCPLLDYRIAEFCFEKVPGRYKIHNQTRKYLLRKLAQKNLQSDLDLNRKHGFSIPLSDWFRGEKKEYFEALLLESDNPYFDKQHILRLWKEHQAGG